ncbi:MAG: helicase HerA-like domain-containing protein, partial [Polyangiaceae bacterium]
MLALGRRLDPAAPAAAPEAAAGTPAWLAVPPHHLVTHAAIVGMTGSGKTGLITVLVEEALRSRIPVLLIDIKGDLPNLALAFPKLSPEEFAPWVDEDAAAREGKTREAVAAELAERWRTGLAGWGLGPADVAAFSESVAVRVLTPGTTAGEPVHVLSSLEMRSPLWEEDEEAAREAVSASVSLLLRLVERDADPARSRDHIVLSLLAERRHRAHQPAGLAELLGDLSRMPIDHV